MHLSGLSLAGVAKETVEIVERGSYTCPAGHVVELRAELEAAFTGTVLHRPGDFAALPSRTPGARVGRLGTGSRRADGVPAVYSSPTLDDTARMAAPSRAPVLRHVPTLGATLLFFVMLGLAVVLFLGRKPGALRSAAIVERVPDFYTHVSNFSISYLLIAGIGYAWLMMGAGMKPVMWLVLAVAAANLVYEGFIPLLNTPDPIDAVYGLVGAALGLAVMGVIDRKGLRPNPAQRDAEPPVGKVPGGSGGSRI